MGRYRKRDREVMAFKLSKDNADELTEWCNGVLVHTTDALNAEDIQVGINVPTKDGKDRAGEGDYILRHEDGTFEIMHGLHFESDFEEVT